MNDVLSLASMTTDYIIQNNNIWTVDKYHSVNIKASLNHSSEPPTYPANTGFSMGSVSRLARQLKIVLSPG